MVQVKHFQFSEFGLEHTAWLPGGASAGSKGPSLLLLPLSAGGVWAGPPVPPRSPALGTAESVGPGTLPCTAGGLCGTCEGLRGSCLPVPPLGTSVWVLAETALLSRHSKGTEEGPCFRGNGHRPWLKHCPACGQALAQVTPGPTAAEPAAGEGPGRPEAPAAVLSVCFPLRATNQVTRVLVSTCPPTPGRLWAGLAQRPPARWLLCLGHKTEWPVQEADRTKPFPVDSRLTDPNWCPVTRGSCSHPPSLGQRGWRDLGGTRL